MPSRRDFLATVTAAAVLPIRPATLRTGPHPTPRRGITASKVATTEQLAGKPEAIQIFELVREIPAVVDGIRCQCGCMDGKDYYSLLSCFETPDMMASQCLICQAQARLVHRLHKAGKTLDEIRRGVDARFG